MTRLPTVGVVALGQLVSIFVATSTVFTKLYQLTDVGPLPLFQYGCIYLLVAAAASLLGCCDVRLDEGGASRDERSLHAIPWTYFAFVAFCDVHGNLLSVVALSLTSAASVILLDCFTIPLVVLISRAVLSVKYRWQHYLFVAVCLLGFALIVYSDAANSASDQERSSRTPASPGASVLLGPHRPHPGILPSGDGGWWSRTLGDLLCLLASLFYSCSNVGSEYLLRRGVPQCRLLRRIASIAALLASGELLIFARHELRAPFSAPSLAYFIGAVGSVAAMYLCTPLVLTKGGAAFFNLSLLSSDVFVVLASFALFGDRFSLLYLLGFVLLMVGLIGYNRWPLEYPPLAARDVEGLMVAHQHDDQRYDGDDEGDSHGQDDSPSSHGVAPLPSRATLNGAQNSDGVGSDKCAWGVRRDAAGVRGWQTGGWRAPAALKEGLIPKTCRGDGVVKSLPCCDSGRGYGRGTRGVLSVVGLMLTVSSCSWR
ncbi:unnamed protein product [Vitrella brassicaformis CCMP3155]|uniref:EamA domain-containing protein n=1 Tax=Vitrella brassicaformis (strain CCMP3155) TaxID=1169540 RepID=A0A0G4H7A2_VITBC|nr:unnamed protein product [Vitrella brassicaformis CCMP3155]|eukprot:CEM39620.1 unnamed protein product [Vitrella brassicaformis CCMP3155]